MEKPKVEFNRAAWRVCAVAAVIAALALALAATLLAQTELWTGNDSDQIDPLTSLALLLAIVAFFVQLFVYVFQSNASNRAVERSEELNSKAANVLEEIKATSRSTQQVMVAQFDRLLDYVVGAPEPSGGGGEQEDGDIEEPGPPGETPITVADLDRALREFHPAPQRRPDFGIASSGADVLNRGATSEDLELVRWYEQIPGAEEAKEAADAVLKLPPLSAARLRAMGEHERERKRQGKSSGYRKNPGRGSDWAPTTKRLIDDGLAAEVDGRAVLTDAGRKAARIMLVPHRKELPPELRQQLERII